LAIRFGAISHEGNYVVWVWMGKIVQLYLLNTMTMDTGFVTLDAAKIAVYIKGM